MRRSMKQIAMILSLVAMVNFLWILLTIRNHLQAIDTTILLYHNAHDRQDNHNVRLPGPENLNVQRERNERWSSDALERVLLDSSDRLADSVNDMNTSVISWNVVQDPQQISAASKSYFKDIERFPQVKTLTVRYGFTRLSEILPIRTYYNYSSNNCSKLMYPGSTKLVLEAQSHAECTSDFARTLEPVGLRPLIGSLQNGLPPETNVFPDVILSFVHVIQGGYIDNEGIVTSRDVTIRSQGCGMDTVGGKYNPEWTLIDKIFVISERWGEAFFHSLVENLPRLLPWLKYLQENPTIKIHIKSMYHNIIQKVFNISYSRVTAGNIRANLIILPAGIPCGKPAVYPTQLLWYQIHKQLPAIPMEERMNLVLIKRLPRKNRYFAFHKDIHRLLVIEAEKHNMTVVVFDDQHMPSFEDTMLMFNQAFMVVSPHGAGLTNMLFSQPGTILIEGLCRAALNLCFGAMSQVLGFRYYGHFRDDKDCFEYTAEELAVSIRFYLRRRRAL
ncbi:hypothetical protein CAPTEDRAFT_191413 [Capitella teleta]|uniref:Glycosyltransferase 61 catalytic domain-containing protein n=1 Tax=Capitella teleta TaxID=283909 RepID=R7TI98_CAPTE|nr:hypothetical protein CAPTEDRAFT_191413 [Capitella teleta]|eukprot:ELT93454.1 hypothetical protein CAPTEDRAFT_191413 [Capitella teleta]